MGDTGASDTRAEIREFLASRRAKVTPDQVGLPAGGGKRRVPGLRREEVAVLAGVSTDWYIRLEKGHIGGVSMDVLDAVARALRLDEAERAHLFDLARAARPTRAPRRRARSQVRPSIARIVDSMLTTPAFVRNGRLDLLAINASAGRARRPAAPQRHQALPAPRRRPPGPRLRGHGAARRPRPHPHRLHPRTRIPLRGRPAPARQLGRHRRTRHEGPVMQLHPVRPTARAPAERFAGEVYLTPIYSGTGPSRMSVTPARFTPWLEPVPDEHHRTADQHRG